MEPWVRRILDERGFLPYIAAFHQYEGRIARGVGPSINEAVKRGLIRNTFEPRGVAGMRPGRRPIALRVNRPAELTIDGKCRAARVLLLTLRRAVAWCSPPPAGSSVLLAVRAARPDRWYRFEGVVISSDAATNTCRIELGLPVDWEGRPLIAGPAALRPRAPAIQDGANGQSAPEDATPLA